MEKWPTFDVGLGSFSQHKIEYVCIAPHMHIVRRLGGHQCWKTFVLALHIGCPICCICNAHFSDAQRVLRAGPQSIAQWMLGTSTQQQAFHANCQSHTLILQNTDHDRLCPVLCLAEQKTFQLSGHHRQWSLEWDAQPYLWQSLPLFWRVGWWETLFLLFHWIG